MLSLNVDKTKFASTILKTKDVEKAISLSPRQNATVSHKAKNNSYIFIYFHLERNS